MQVRSISAAAAVGIVALCSVACNPATKSKAAPTVVSQTATAATAAVASVAASPPPSAGSQSVAASAPAISASSPAASSSAAAAPAPAAGGGAVDVCSLMTSAQASSINGVTYGAATPQHVEAGFDVCTYTNTGKAISPIDIQDLTTQVISLAGCYSQLQDANGPGTKVAGVGDDAFGYSIGITVKLGNRCIEVEGLTAAEFHDNYAPDVAMAKIMISKLS